MKGVNDGRGFMFVSHRGEVMPSGFLPLAAGNVSRARAFAVTGDHLASDPSCPYQPPL